jgi:hypothetical protein
LRYNPGARAILAAGILVTLATIASTHVDAVIPSGPNPPTPESTAGSLPPPPLEYTEYEIALEAREVTTTLQAVDAQASAPSTEALPIPTSTAWPPPPEEVVSQVRATFPEDPDTAERIVFCESRAGQHPRTYDLEVGHAGPMQIAKRVWEPFFRDRYGWDWEEVVRNLSVHLQAARIIWERSGWAAWECY